MYKKTYTLFIKEIKMKVMLFAHDQYYPLGGINDFKGVFTDKKTLIDEMLEFKEYEFLQVFDMETLKTIYFDKNDIYPNDKRMWIDKDLEKTIKPPKFFTLEIFKNKLTDY